MWLKAVLLDGDFGRHTRLSISYVSMLERGQRVPPLPTLEALAKAFGVSPVYLCQPLTTMPRHKRRAMLALRGP